MWIVDSGPKLYVWIYNQNPKIIVDLNLKLESLPAVDCKVLVLVNMNEAELTAVKVDSLELAGVAKLL